MYINVNAINSVTSSLRADLAARQSDAVVARSFATEQSHGFHNEIATTLRASHEQLYEIATSVRSSR